jgi:hypothetical protein
LDFLECISPLICTVLAPPIPVLFPQHYSFEAARLMRKIARQRNELENFHERSNGSLVSPMVRQGRDHRAVSGTIHYAASLPKYRPSAATLTSDL